MSNSTFDEYEHSISRAEPVEIYLFSYNGTNYAYTSGKTSVTTEIDHVRFTFVPEYIQRGSSLKSTKDSSTSDSCTITVTRLNPIALLFQGSPPEQDSVTVSVYRFHGDLHADKVCILSGFISQVSFADSTAELTVTLDNLTYRLVPRGSLSYYCQNCIYDDKCGLIADSYGHKCTIDLGMYSTVIYSTNLLEKVSGYFTDGYIKMGNCYRAITEHKDSMIKLKYPVPETEQFGSFVAYPGCSNLFSVCADRFSNTDNFSGIPYTQPYNPYTHVAGKGVYWINSEVISRDTHGTVYN